MTPTEVSFSYHLMLAKSKVPTDVVDELLYADDQAENAKSEEKCKGL